MRKSIDSRLAWLLAICVIGVFAQISLGGVVRVTDSGLGCPDWPLCNGRLVPAAEFHTLLEYSHRVVGILVGLFLVATTLRVWMRHRANSKMLFTITAATFLVMIVGGVGGAVVLSELHPALRTAHLALAEIVLLLSIMGLASHIKSPINEKSSYTTLDKSGNRRHWLLAIAAAMTLAALLSGSYAVWRGAGAVCPSWPLCGGTLIPESGLVWVHMVHRLLALVASVITILIVVIAMLQRTRARVRMDLAATVLVIVGAQILIGAANPWSEFSSWSRAIHLSLGTMVWGALSLLTALSWPDSNKLYRVRSTSQTS